MANFVLTRKMDTEDFEGAGICAILLQTATQQLVKHDADSLRSVIDAIMKKASALELKSEIVEAKALVRQADTLQHGVADVSSECELAIKGVNVEEINAIRRVMLADVRYLGVDVVSISANSSLMFDEMLASRVAHIPLHAQRSRLDDDGYRVELRLEARHTGDLGIVNVMSDDVLASDPTVHVQKGMRLARLQPGQSISLTAVARPGTGREHTKWRAVHTAVVLRPEHAKLSKGTEHGLEGMCILKVGTNSQTTALQSVVDAINELQLRIRFAKDDVLNPTGGSDVDLVDPFDVVGVGYA